MTKDTIVGMYDNYLFIGKKKKSIDEINLRKEVRYITSCSEKPSMRTLKNDGLLLL